MSVSSIRFGSAVEGVRSEDYPLLTGNGQFSDDLNVDGQLHAVFVRAPVAHADIDNIEIRKALAVPGVDVRIFGKRRARPYRRMAVCLALAETLDEAKKNALRASETVRLRYGD